MSEIEILKCITFYSFAVLTVFFALISIIANRIMYSLIAAIAVFFCAGGIFFSLGADYNAVIQVAIYGVAVPVIFLIAIMFTSEKENKTVYLSFTPRFFISFISISLLFMIIWYTVKLAINMNSSISLFNGIKLFDAGGFNSIFAVAKGLYIDYCLALLLFAVCIAIIIVGISVLNVIKEKRRVR